MGDKNCQSCSLQQEGSCRGLECPEEKAMPNSSGAKQMIAVMSGKGGVGKSTVSSLLAIGLREKGYQVAILDADITGPSIPRAFGITGVPSSTASAILPLDTKTGIKVMSINLLLSNEDDPVIWRGPLLAGAVKQFWEETEWNQLDYMIVDLPPGTGDVPLTVLQSLPITGVLIISSPQDLVSMVVKKSIKMAQKMGKPIVGLVENMSGVICPHCGQLLEIFGKSTGKKVAAEMGIAYLGGLKWDPNLMELVDAGKIEDYDSSDVQYLTDKIVNSINTR